MKHWGLSATYNIYPAVVVSFVLFPSKNAFGNLGCQIDGQTGVRYICQFMDAIQIQHWYSSASRKRFQWKSYMERGSRF